MALAKAFWVTGYSMSRSERIEMLIAAVGGPTKAAELLKVSRATLHNWTSKPDARLPFDEIEALARAGGVSMDWVATGYERRPSTENSEQEFVIVYRYEPGQSGTLVRMDENGGDIAFRNEWLKTINIKAGDAGLLVAHGDAMAPTISDGTTVIVDRSVTRVSADGIYAIAHGMVLTIRRVQILVDGSLKLLADNARYDPELVSAGRAADLKIAGRVRAAIAPL